MSRRSVNTANVPSASIHSEVDRVIAMYPEGLLPTNVHNVMCSPLPMYWAKNTPLPEPFRVLCLDSAVPDDTLVSLSASSAPCLNATLKNNRCRTKSSVATFTDLRFCSGSGLKKTFSLLITIHSEPQRYAVCKDVIKVTSLKVWKYNYSSELNRATLFAPKDEEFNDSSKFTPSVAFRQPSQGSFEFEEVSTKNATTKPLPPSPGNQDTAIELPEQENCDFEEISTGDLTETESPPSSGSSNDSITSESPFDFTLPPELECHYRFVDTESPKIMSDF